MARLKVDPKTGKLVSGGGLLDIVLGPGSLFEPTGNPGDVKGAMDAFQRAIDSGDMELAKIIAPVLGFEASQVTALMKANAAAALIAFEED